MDGGAELEIGGLGTSTEEMGALLDFVFLIRREV